MSTPQERLKQLRIDKGITQKQIAEILGITVSGYQYYEHGKREISIKALTTLADYFDVSTDYLLGRSDDPKRY
ncbi:MAG: helix-turn-helix transcriptional regulator [Clostridiales bacterium]|nr:helix-turn-helix transcriptional regulator [Clostridiales bacterium]